MAKTVKRQIAEIKKNDKEICEMNKVEKQNSLNKLDKKDKVEQKNCVTLENLKKGESGIIKKVKGEEILRRRLLDMGLTPRTEIKLIKVAPFNDPIEIFVRGYNLTLRLEEARNIEMEI